TYSISISMCAVFVSLLINSSYAQSDITNQYFSIKPDNWTYIEYSHTPQSQTTGFGPGNQIWLTPSDFSDILLSPDSENYSKKIEGGGAVAFFIQDTNYRLKNAFLILLVTTNLNSKKKKISRELRKGKYCCDNRKC
ncbi:MAG: hypothetical protein WBN72_07330, partial [Nitrososphaeraceae archaeon]